MMAPEDAFRLLADGLGKAGTPQAFEHLVERIASIFDGDHVLIGKLMPNNETILTVAFWSRGSLQPVRIPANVTAHSGDRDRFAHRSLAGSGFVS
ncbi:hypothetical protein DU490_11000 [Halomonas sp. DQ26W]|uniref:hypothetical protein n=1 Tax=Halomonas sp. DQ26W TaxID=2282311 RepID=UPI000DF7D8AC|nr:hypothetical protein [Halomonas sp. DQ26W]RDB42899.1 hypothetical protein DU490_11000 [Halomonas sp. DQ26W]